MKEVFKQTKGDIKLFIHYQNSLSIDNLPIPFVPKMITEAFTSIYRLKTINKIDNMTVFQALNGSLLFSDQMDSCLQIIINSINRGNWESIFRCGDIVLIAELLYVWFDESVKCCINPNRINKLFNDDVIKSNQSLFEHNVNIDRANDSSYPIEDIKVIDKVIQNHLRKYEFETLIYIVKFIQRLKLDTDNDSNNNDNNDNNDEESQMIEKLSTFLLGYNIKLLYDDITKAQGYYLNIHKLISLIQYLRKVVGFKEKEIMIAKSLTFSQSNLSNKRNEMIKSIHINSQIDKEQDEELFNYYLLLQDHFNNGTSNHQRNNKGAKFDIQSNSDKNPIVKDYTMKNEIFKAYAIDLASSDNAQLNINDKVNDKDNGIQSNRNKFRTTKPLKLLQFSHKGNSNIYVNNTPKKLWIKEEDC